MEKNKLTVSIGNREFNIVTDEAPEYVDVLVADVNGRLAEITRETLGLSGIMGLSLLALNLADELHKCRSEQEAGADAAGEMQTLREEGALLSRRIAALEEENKRLREKLNKRGDSASAGGVTDISGSFGMR